MTNDEIAPLIGIDPATIKEDAWIPKSVSDDGLVRTDIYWVEPPRPGFGGISVERKVYLQLDELIEANQEEYNDGQGLVRANGTPLDAKVAQIPLETYYNEIAPSVREGDKDFFKHWINKDENKKFKTQKGTW